MVSSSQSIAALAPNRITGRNGLIDRYFYFFMSLFIAAIVVWGFSHTINERLFHPAITPPRIVWFHAAAFSAWLVFYIFQSTLVRTGNVKLHRLFGWFGAALAATMVPLGFTAAVIMGRFDKHVLHLADSDTFLSIPFGDMVIFGTLVTLAILWRKKPEVHRRLLLIATCALTTAAFGRVDFIAGHALFTVCADSLILLGVVRDLLVNRRVHKVYLIALPLVVLFHVLDIYLWRGAPAWWLHLSQSILG
jgi:hypothetical protein